MQRRLKLTAMILASLAIGSAIWLGPKLETTRLDPHLLSGTMNQQFTVSDGWQSIRGLPTDSAQITRNVTKSSVTRLVFELPGFQVSTVEAAGQQCSRIDVPGLIKIKTPHYPELPVVTTTLPVSGAEAVQFKITEHIMREIVIAPVEPSKGHLTRDIDPATVVAQFGQLYNQGGVWPATPVVVGKPFQLQNQFGVNLRFNPLRYDASRGVLVVTERLVVEVLTPGGLDKSLASPSREFGPVSKALFGSTSTLPTDKYETIAILGRMLIITPEVFESAVTPLAHWKRQRGIPTDLVTVPNAGVTTEEIASIITTAFYEPEGLTWVILVGDRAEMPPATGRYDGSDSDTRYTMISGEDLYPDLFISRISASSAVQVATQVNKFIAYEKYPATGTDALWYNRATVIASDLGTPTDIERAELLRTELLSYGYQPVDQIYQNAGGTTAQIRASLIAGSSLVNYIGHGSGYSWDSVLFRQSHVAAVGNSNKLPWVIDVSCSNGDIALADCFAETWLRAGTPTASAGAVGMIAASSLAPWVPPTVMQSEAVRMLTTDQAFSLGALYFSGLMQVADHYAGLPVAERVIEQNIIFGDCSLVVRTEAPSGFGVDCPTTLALGASRLSLDISGPAGSVVTLTSDGVLYATAFVNGGLPLEFIIGEWANDLTAVEVTVTGGNMVPWISAVSLTGEETPLTLDPPIVPSQIKLLGNFPNPFNPSTRIAFELPADSSVTLKVYNIRGQLVRDLSTGMTAAGAHEVPWDGQDRSGQPAPSGVYLYKLDAAGQRLTGRMTLSK